MGNRFFDRESVLLPYSSQYDKNKTEMMTLMLANKNVTISKTKKYEPTPKKKNTHTQFDFPFFSFFSIKYAHTTDTHKSKKI